MSHNVPTIARPTYIPAQAIVVPWNDSATDALDVLGAAFTASKDAPIGDTLDAYEFWGRSASRNEEGAETHSFATADALDLAAWFADPARSTY